MATNTPMLELVRVSKRFAGADGTDLSVLNEICLRVNRGETVAIVGPSGSGKSTLLHIMGTLDRPTGGQVLLDGVDLAGMDEAQTAEVRNRQIGFVFQSHYLLPQCTVWENVLVPTLARGRSEDRETKAAPGGELPEARAGRLLRRVGLAARLGHRPAQLSGGECQRVAVVRALVNRPALLLADEPTGSLDHASATALGQLLVELNHEEQATLVVVTHASELAARMDRVLRLTDGRLVEEGG